MVFHKALLLDPLLFIIYINDLPLSIKNCKTDLYADDTTLHKSGKDLEDLQVKVQQDLTNVEQWCERNNMFINTEKTKCMLICTKQRQMSLNNQPLLLINSEILKFSECEKLLGVKIDKNLSWKAQIDNICKNISSRIYLLIKIKKFLNHAARNTFYNGYILPLIDYCCVVWGGCGIDLLSRIVKLQKRAARVILDADPFAPSEPLFKTLGWMTVDKRIKYHKYLLMHKVINDEAPVYLSSMFKFSDNPYPLRNNNSMKKLTVPRPNIEMYKQSFLYSGSNLWNDLPTTFHNVPNKNVYKTKIKNFLQSHF